MATATASSPFPVTELGESFDPLDAEGMAEFYARARREEPIFYSPRLDMVVVTSFEDIERIMKDTDTFSATAVLELIKPLCPEAGQIAGEAGVRVDRSIVDEDPPDHTVKRKALRPPFHPSGVAEFQPVIEQLVGERIDRFVRDGQADLVGDLMFEVPALVVFKLFGLADSELATVRKFAKNNAKFGFGYPTDKEQVQDAKDIAEYWKWCQARVDDMFDDPGDDVIGQYVRNMRSAGDLEITKEDTATLMMQLLFAGHETTANSSGNMFRFLLTYRDQWDAVCEDPSLVVNAVEECLRFASPVPQWRRITRQPVNLRGWDIPEGQVLMIALASANQDEAKFGDDSTRLDVRRENAKEHIAFGTGRHRCLGENLARQELRIALREVTRRLPHARLVEGQTFEYSANTSHRGNEHVLIEWDPAENPVVEDRP